MDDAGPGRIYRDDFDEILLLECGERSLTALAGDLGEQLGLCLEGELANNLERLRDFCFARRFLLLLADVRARAPNELIFGGRCSTLISTGGGLEPSNDVLREVQQVLLGLQLFYGVLTLNRDRRQMRHLAYDILLLLGRAAGPM